MSLHPSVGNEVVINEHSSQEKKRNTNVRPCSYVSGYFQNRDLFSPFSLLSTSKWRFPGKKTRKLSKAVPRREFVQLKTPAYRSSVGGRKRKFFNTMMSYITQRKPCKECYLIFIVLVFTSGRAKTIRIRYVWVRTFFRKRRKKSSFTKNFRIRVDET